MSYKTNPITNRFKINKGWINANFPENLSFYARDNVFFFKLYLFLKAYFTLRNIKLISCQIRIGQDHVPILYLIINHTAPKKQKRSNSTFRHLWPRKRAGFKYSPLRNPANAEALTLMFWDSPRLKQIFQARCLPLSKQKPTRFWLTKPRRKTWMNFLAKVRKSRKQSLRSQHIKQFSPNHVKLFKYKIQSSLEFKFSRALKEFRLLQKIRRWAFLPRLLGKTDFTPQTLTFYQQRLKTISHSIHTIHAVLSQIQQRRQFQKKRKLLFSQKARAKKLILQFQHKQLKFFFHIFQKSRFYDHNLDSFKRHIWRQHPMSRQFGRTLFKIYSANKGYKRHKLFKLPKSNPVPQFFTNQNSFFWKKLDGKSSTPLKNLSRLTAQKGTKEQRIKQLKSSTKRKKHSLSKRRRFQRQHLAIFKRKKHLMWHQFQRTFLLKMTKAAKMAKLAKIAKRALDLPLGFLHSKSKGPKIRTKRNKYLMWRQFQRTLLKTYKRQKSRTFQRVSQKTLKNLHNFLQKSDSQRRRLLFKAKMKISKKIRSKRLKRRKVRKLKFLRPWTRKINLKLTPNKTKVKNLILQLLTLRSKMDPVFNGQRGQRFLRFQIQRQRIGTIRKTISRQKTTSALPFAKVFLKPMIQKHSMRNLLINQLLNQKLRLVAKNKKRSRKRVSPLLLQQLQHLRNKKKNWNFNVLDRTPMSSAILNQYRFKPYFTNLHPKTSHPWALRLTKSQASQSSSARMPKGQEDPTALKSGSHRFDSQPKLWKAHEKQKTKQRPNQTRTYRQSFRKSYKRHLNLLVRYQYKFWLQKVLQIFFHTRFEVKFTQPLTQFKNLKFWRLVYTLPHFYQHTQRTKLTTATLKKNLYSAEQKFLRKRYIYLGHLRTRFKPQKSNLRKRKLRKRAKSSSNRQRLQTKRKKVKNLSKSLKTLNTYRFQKKADLFKRARRKKLRDFRQKRLGFLKRQLLMRQFLPILSLFIKYFNPQILADHIAKEFEKTKKHRNILFALKTALRSLKSARGLGYRIAIVGRINSSTKSRAFYLTKKNLIRQNFSKQINYATAQAKARIGSFGIKVWLFY